MAKRKRQRRKHSFAPDRGLVQNQTPTLINERNTPSCNNVKFRNGEVSKSPGYTLFASDGLPLGNNGTTGSRVMALPDFTLLNGSVQYLAITIEDAFLFNATTKRWGPMGVVVDACETAWTAADAGANVTASAVTDRKVGDKAVKFVIEVGTGEFAAGDDIGYKSISNVDYSADNRVHFWIKSSIAQGAGDIILRFSDDAAIGTGNDYADVDVPALTAATWHRFDLDIDLSDIDSCSSVGLTTLSGTGKFDDSVDSDVYIDQVIVSTKWPHSPDKDDQWSFARQAGAGTSQESTPTWFLVGSNGATGAAGNAVNIWSWNGSDDEFTALTGSLDSNVIGSAKVVVSYTDTLGLMNTYEQLGGTEVTIPQRFRFGDTAELDDWTTGVAGFIDSYDTPGGILAATLLGPYLVAYKTDGIILFQYNGNASPVMDRDARVTGNQFFAYKAIASANNIDYFLTRENVRIFAGLHDAPAIGDPIRDELFSLLDFSKKLECFAFVQPGYHRIWFVIPHTEGTTTTKFYTYDYIEKTWTKGEFADYITCAGFYEGGGSLTIDQASGTIDAQIGTIDDQTSEGTDRVVLLGDKGGYTYQLSETDYSYHDTAIDAEWQSKDFSLAPDYMERAMRFGRLSYVARGNQLSVSYSVDSGANWTEIITDQTLTTDRAEYNIALNFSAPKIRFKAHDDTINYNFWLSSLSIEYIFSTTRE